MTAALLASARVVVHVVVRADVLVFALLVAEQFERDIE
jgi:hypothetical protein